MTSRDLERSNSWANCA